MTRFSRQIAVVMVVAAFLDVSCSFKRKKYDNPITKDTQQPDKKLFDKAIKDIEHGHYEVARLTLNTLINTYDTSEFLAKAKLAMADSWYREGGTHGLAQAEAEYKDFILFYPAMEEAAESQKKICDIHYSMMEKADRDPNNALRAEQECRTLITQFPNSKFVPQTEQELREIQEVLAQAEFDVGAFQLKRGTNAAAANRFEGLVTQYPLFSHADLSLWDEGDAYSKMGPRFRQKEGETLAKLVKEYPLSPYADLARKKLQSLELPVPEADPAAVARMKFEQENRTKQGTMSKMLDPFKSAPNVTLAAKAGSPTMTNPRPTIPASVPVAAGQTGITDVTAAPVTDPTALERLPDARTNGGAGTTGAGTTTPATGAKPEAPAPGTAPAANGVTPATADAKPAAAAAQSTSTSTSTKTKKPSKKNTKSTKSTSTSTSTSTSSNH
jgi:outer membrane protein assembly factor BamD